MFSITRQLLRAVFLMVCCCTHATAILHNTFSPKAFNWSVTAGSHSYSSAWFNLSYQKVFNTRHLFLGENGKDRFKVNYRYILPNRYFDQNWFVGLNFQHTPLPIAFQKGDGYSHYSIKYIGLECVNESGIVTTVNYYFSNATPETVEKAKISVTSGYEIENFPLYALDDWGISTSVTYPLSKRWNTSFFGGYVSLWKEHEFGFKKDQGLIAGVAIKWLLNNMISLEYRYTLADPFKYKKWFSLGMRVSSQDNNLAINSFKGAFHRPSENYCPEYWQESVPEQYVSWFIFEPNANHNGSSTDTGYNIILGKDFQTLEEKNFRNLIEELAKEVEIKNISKDSSCQQLFRSASLALHPDKVDTLKDDDKKTRLNNKYQELSGLYNQIKDK